MREKKEENSGRKSLIDINQNKSLKTKPKCIVLHIVIIIKEKDKENREQNRFVR